MKKLLVILLLVFFPVHGAWAEYDEETRKKMDEIFGKKEGVYDEETRRIMDEIFGMSEEELELRLKLDEEKKTWWQKQKDKIEDRKNAKVTCAHFAGRKANTDKMAKLIYNDCMERMGH